MPYTYTLLDDPRLTVMFTGHPALTADMEYWAGSREFAFEFADAYQFAHRIPGSPLADAASPWMLEFYMAFCAEGHHQRALANLPPALHDAYFDRLEVREAVDSANRALPITSAAIDALNPLNDALNDALNAALNTPCTTSTADRWQGNGTLHAFSAVCAALRMAIWAQSEGQAQKRILATSALDKLPMRLAEIITGAMADALPVVGRGSGYARKAGTGVKTFIGHYNNVIVPGLLRAHSALATAAGQSAELDDLHRRGWEVLPRCVCDAGFILGGIYFLFTEYATDSNPDAKLQMAQLGGEWRSVNNALLDAEKARTDWF